jgi:hypothetical protein
MGVDGTVLDPPSKSVLDILNGALEVLFELILELGCDWGSDRR